MKFSIIVPAYNGEKYIEETLDCLLSQTEQSVEVIVVNDGSTDRTEEIVKEYASKECNYIIICGHYEGIDQRVLDEIVDEEKYATQVARMFTIDLYTLSTKVNKYDVGGIEYYHITKKDMFSKKVIDTLYSSLLDDTYGDRDQDLPEIKSVETVSTEKTTYKLGEEEVPAYLVKLNLTYEEELGYDNSASVIVCKEDSVRLSVVDFQPTLNPTYK